ncbi:MAG: hypothetical protein JKY54_03990 [Flavobacteriales bacterium]|nr:hypothetical protein [Flavobacteriales bacterium]
MSNNDAVVISSTYIGPTNDETSVPTHSVVIFRKHEKHYASYYKSEQRRPLIWVQPISPQPPKFDPQILLSEEQVQQFRAFEENFLDLSINDNLKYQATANNSIRLNGKNISFYSKGYVGLLLWN